MSVVVAATMDTRSDLHEVPPGVSTTTFVDLITATASDAGLQPELADRLAGHQRDHPVRAALQLDLGHHPVGDHRR